MAVCYLFALEGATVAFTYVKGQEDVDSADALELYKKAKMSEACDPIVVPTDVRSEENCMHVSDEVVARFGRIDVLVNNAVVQFYSKSIEEVSTDQLRTTFETNFFAYFFMARFALRHMKEGCSIINTTSLTAYSGEAKLLEYNAAKGALVSFTRSLALQLIDRRIRVNEVAPGPVWTPLGVASLPVYEIVKLGS